VLPSLLSEERGSVEQGNQTKNPMQTKPSQNSKPKIERAK